MRDELPLKLKDVECGIINLDNGHGLGTHWTAYFKNGNIKYYFDSYGNLPPPKELVRYLGKDNMYYNYDGVQQAYDPPICGHLCLVVLKELSDGSEYNTIIHKIKNDRYYWKSYFI